MVKNSFRTSVERVSHSPRTFLRLTVLKHDFGSAKTTFGPRYEMAVGITPLFWEIWRLHLTRGTSKQPLSFWKSPDYFYMLGPIKSNPFLHSASVIWIRTPGDLVKDQYRLNFSTSSPMIASTGSGAKVDSSVVHPRYSPGFRSYTAPCHKSQTCSLATGSRSGPNLVFATGFGLVVVVRLRVFRRSSQQNLVRHAVEIQNLLKKTKECSRLCLNKLDLRLFTE